MAKAMSGNASFGKKGGCVELLINSFCFPKKSKMIITFRSKNLKKLCEDRAYAQKKLGAECAKRLHRRIDDLSALDEMSALRHLPGRFHPLYADREGQWACDLEHPYRLVFEVREQDGQLLAHVLDIVDYH